MGNLHSATEEICRAAVRTQEGHMPPEACNPAAIYIQLAEALEQLGVAIDVEAAGLAT
jgi:hypothetical protein